MGGADQRPAAERLLRQHPARRQLGRCHGPLWPVLRNDRRPGLWLRRWWRQLEADRARSSGRLFRGSANAGVIRVALPAHLRRLAGVSGEVRLDVPGAATQRSVLDALENGYPVLRGTIRDHVTQQRRPFIRFFACQEDLSNEAPDTPLPIEVVSGAEPLMVVGAIAGG